MFSELSSDEERTELLEKCAGVITDMLGKGTVFTIIAHTPDPNKCDTFYCSNGNREDVITCLRELLKYVNASDEIGPQPSEN